MPLVVAVNDVGFPASSQPSFGYDPCACRLSLYLYGVKDIPQESSENNLSILHLTVVPISYFLDSSIVFEDVLNGICSLMTVGNKDQIGGLICV